MMALQESVKKLIGMGAQEPGQRPTAGSKAIDVGGAIRQEQIKQLHRTTQAIPARFPRMVLGGEYPYQIRGLSLAPMLVE